MEDTTTTLSREDALTLECYDTDDEFEGSTEFSELDTEDELEMGDEADDFWPTDEQVAAWDAEASTWRNEEAYSVRPTQYDASGEI